MDLKMEVYTPTLELIGELEEYQSVIWEDKAFSTGSFSADALLTEKTRQLLTEENILWIGGDTAGRIEHYDKKAENGAYVTVKGRLLTGILDQRILWGLYDMTGTPPEIMHRLVDDCAVNPTRGDIEARKIPGLVLLDAPTGGNKIRIQKTGGSLLEALETIGAAYHVAFGVRFNPAFPRMEFWTRWGTNRGVNQSTNDPVFYSTELDDVLRSEYSYDSTGWRNVALVAGEGEGNNRTMVVVEAEVPETPDVPTPPTPPEPQKVTITLNVDPEGGGTASGGNTVTSGEQITVTAAPSAGYSFAGWRENGAIVSADAEYTFTAASDRTLTAVFEVVIPTYDVTISIAPAESGTVSGAGTYQEGDTITITATPGEGYKFSGWQENGTVVSIDAEYTFSVTADRALTAMFEEHAFSLEWNATNMPSSANWYGIAYGGGKFVAVAGSESNKAAYSDDGITWIATTLPSSAYWQSVTYGNGKFVAVASIRTTTIAYSVDGITWKPATLQNSLGFECVAYGAGKFVALSSDGKAVYSEDGITWQETTLPADLVWHGIAYGNGKFVAVSSSGAGSDKAIYSEDGITWKNSTLPNAENWQSIAYGSGKFVAVAYGSEKYAYSEDGIFWTEATFPSSANWQSITYGSGNFAVVSRGGTTSIYSADGINWNAVALPSSVNWYNVAHGNNKFVAVAYGTAKAAYSNPL